MPDRAPAAATYVIQAKPCEICDGDEFVAIQTRGRVAQAGIYGDLPIAACRRCGYTMQNPRYEDAFYRNYYALQYRNVTFGQYAPGWADIREQVNRGRRVMSYVHRFVASPGTMLDHGCAAGGVMKPFADAGWQVCGVDPHLPSVDAGRRLLALDIRSGSGENLPCENRSVDLVLSLGSLEHVYDFGKAMQETRRVLVPGGLLLIRWRADRLWGSPLEYYNHNHYRYFTRKTWRLALWRHGFSIVDETDVELEEKPGEVYTLARSDREPSLDAIHDALRAGDCDSADEINRHLAAYRIAFAGRCREFLEFCAERGGDAHAIARAARVGEIGYRILLGEPKWAVERARLEAVRYLEEYAAGGVI
jgi:SAM-dependent methyltransferase